MEIIQNTAPSQKRVENSVTFGDIFSQCLANWKWIVLCLLVSIGLATFYLLRTPSVYTRTAALQIKQESQGKSINGAESFGEYGLFQSNTNISNEMIAMRSPAVMTEVVKRLQLDMNYYLPGRFHKEVAYGNNLPATVTMPGFPENETASFTLELDASGHVTLGDFVRNGAPLADGAVKGAFHQTLNTPLGKLSVTPTPQYSKGTAYRLEVVKQTVYGAVGSYTAALSVSQNDQKSSIIDLKVTDFSIRRAEDLLNTLIVVYNENWVKDKNQIAVSTSQFIGERLAVIEQELGHVDSNISTFKSENLMPDVNAASNMYLQQSSTLSAQIQDLNNQLYMTRYVRNYLSNEANKMQLLPANSGIANSNIESQISEYNTQLLQRNNLVANSSTQNPLVVDMDQALASLRSAMLRSVDNHMVTLNAQLKSLQQSERKATNKLAANPDQAKYLLSVERQQKVKESLYLFLLQKREENELSQAFTAYNTRIITPPTGSSSPTAPVRGNILMLAVMIGLIVPISVIVLFSLIYSKVRGRKDVEHLSVPLLGEIPFHGKPKHWWQRSSRKQERFQTVVEEGSRDIINEAFRVLRSNLDFMSGSAAEGGVFITTSFNPGSGKSFLTANMALSYALKGKKVLCIDGDMRHGSLSAYANNPKLGLSDYLSGRASSLKEVIVEHENFSQVEMIPVGTVPPNPTELLENGRLANLVAEARQHYDYVFIDCPPIDIVADTQIISQYADRTLFVVRVGVLERSMLDDLEQMYQEKRFKNLGIVLNGTLSSGRYGYRYGYKYGYHYGKSYYSSK